MEKLDATQWFIFHKDELLLQRGENTSHWQTLYDTELPSFIKTKSKPMDVALPDGRTVKALAIDEAIEETSDWAMVNLRTSYDLISHDDYKAAGKAYQILYWDTHSCFCPVCGTRAEQKTSIMKKCPSCGFEIYPPISTAVIVLIRRGKEILLVHARNFRGTFHGLVAGFLEPGETLEQCVQREVMEETGLRIKNITYFGNQPWPYPSGLMVGFIADYDGGEINLQEDELSAADFYTKENLPEIPRKLSIARRLIDWWLEQQ